ncbi:MAG TPA: hypothetical protein VJN88_00335 [Ktedonobacterales bacterium]|nr:hypothetical protein [Ktedonobacterales bacterium]
MSKKRNREHRRGKMRGRARFELPQPSLLPMAGAPRYSFPQGWARRTRPYRTGKIILVIIALLALIIALTTLLGLIFGWK